MSLKDSMNKFAADFKEMLKTKNTDKMKNEYLMPLLDRTKEVAQKTSDFIVENTPKVVNAGKEAITKIQDSIGKKDETKTEVPKPEVTKTTTTDTSTIKTPSSTTPPTDKKPDDKPKV